MNQDFVQGPTFESRSQGRTFESRSQGPTFESLSQGPTFESRSQGSTFESRSKHNPPNRSSCHSSDNAQKRKASFKPSIDKARRSSEPDKNTSFVTRYTSRDRTSLCPVPSRNDTPSSPQTEDNTLLKSNEAKSDVSLDDLSGSRDIRKASESRDIRKASESSSECGDSTTTPSKKVELKKSTIRSEITKILYKYNHDYITSKIVRTMLMEKFGCDLVPHKKFIDDTIMELLDIIENDPINLKSIPGRIFVDGKICVCIIYIL